MDKLQKPIAIKDKKKYNRKLKHKQKELNHG